MAEKPQESAISAPGCAPVPGPRGRARGRALAAVGDVDDLQALEGEGVGAVGGLPAGGGVRPPVPQEPGGPQHGPAVGLRAARQAQGRQDAAHGARPAPRPGVGAMAARRGVSEARRGAENSFFFLLPHRCRDGYAAGPRLLLRLRLPLEPGGASGVLCSTGGGVLQCPGVTRSMSGCTLQYCRQCLQCPGHTFGTAPGLPPPVLQSTPGHDRSLYGCGSGSGGGGGGGPGTGTYNPGEVVRGVGGWEGAPT